MPKLIRLLVFIALIQLAAFVLAARSGHADVNELMMSVGAQMMRLAGARYQDQPRTVVVNGLALRFTSGSTSRTVTEVLDYYHARCRERDGRLFEQFSELENSRLGNLNFKGQRFIDGVLRYGTDRQGFVGCMDTGAESLEPGEIFRRVKRFLKTGDLSQIGELRYVMAERRANATFFITFWTEGQADLFKAFPRCGDAPGRDPENMLRPPNSRRLLTAWEQDRMPAITIYSSSLSNAAHLESFYREHLDRLGWKILGDRYSRTNKTDCVLSAERNGRTASFVFSTDDRGEKFVTILETG